MDHSGLRVPKKNNQFSTKLFYLLSQETTTLMSVLDNFAIWKIVYRIYHKMDQEYFINKHYLLNK